MALIVEDGSQVVNANSYNSVAEIRSYADARGYDLPVDDADVEILAIQATDYLESFRSRYQGNVVSSTQELQFPRTGVVLDGYYLESDIIPKLLKRAHAQATVEAYSSDLMPNDSQSVKKEKIDVIEIEYQDNTSSNSVNFEKVDALLYPLFQVNTGWPTRSSRA